MFCMPSGPLPQRWFRPQEHDVGDRGKRWRKKGWQGREALLLRQISLGWLYLSVSTLPRWNWREFVAGWSTNTSHAAQTCSQRCLQLLPAWKSDLLAAEKLFSFFFLMNCLLPAMICLSLIRQPGWLELQCECLSCSWNISLESWRTIQIACTQTESSGASLKSRCF